jgi:hypothetical protein
VTKSAQEFTHDFKPILFSGMSCFTILFETMPPSTDEPFILEILGLRKAGAIVQLEPLNFVKQSGWNYSTTSVQ